MIKNKTALIGSAIILGICMYLFFPFPNHKMIGPSATFMSFPIRNLEGYIPLGIIGSILFILAMILLGLGLKKYRTRTIIIVAIAYTFIPMLLITAYQETFARGISAISYDDNGFCTFESVDENILSGDCTLTLHNRSNNVVSFELEFLDSFFMEDEARMESLMNLAGPYKITIEANHEKTIQLKELLDVSNVQKHIDSGSSRSIHLKLSDRDTERIL